MYLETIPTNPFSTTIVKIKYDCCGKEHELKWAVADKNFQKNNGKHICRTCWLKSDSNPAKDKSAKEKAKKTNLEKYGTAMPMNSQENIEKRKKLFEDEEFKKQWDEKHKQTCLERYGVEHQMHIDQVKEKVKATNMERYGVEVPLQNEDILAKAQATNLERYGDICSLNNPEVKAKALKTLFENYGVEYYNQLPEMKDYLRENCTQWLAESYANPWAKGITRPEEWINKQRETVLQLILEGKWLGGYGKGKIQGWYNPPTPKCRKKNPYFRSGPELVAHHYLQFNKDVSWYDYEPFGIDYTLSDGSLHVYVVDFAVKYINKDKVHLIEVKPRFKLLDEKVISKKEAATQFAEVEDLIYEYWDEYFIKSWGYKQDDIMKLPYVKLRSANEH